MSELLLTHAGLDRRYFAVSPGFTESQRLPVVLVLHGGGGNAKQAMETMNLEKLGSKYGALVVYPEGSSVELMGRTFATWNAGACCGRAAKDDVDDVGFIKGVLADLAQRFPIDAARVYVTGHSNGAMMSYRLACALPDRIAAIAPVGGQQVEPVCKPERSVPTLHIHGDADRCANFDGGSCGGCFAELMGFGGAKWECKAVPDAVSRWAQAQGCKASAGAARTEHGASCSSFEGCGASEVTLCVLPRVGHGFPGGSSPLCERDPDGRLCERWQSALGPGAPDYPTADVLWSFFSRHKR